MKRILAIFLLLSVFMGSPAISFAEEKTEPSGSGIVIDVVIIRPLGLASLVIGAGVFVIALPFTVPSGSVKVSAKKLIAEPFKFTFTRPVGAEMPY
ncbi:MAG: hypothetical protein HZB21_06255 [Deltaproteobacteria bacterium]|nr:hypothetical protein [Deltaproteobacteria bacterium]MBI5810770.1 hypothetical protein [Deltaproteobacteria bacterium]